jgi:predicted ATPase
VLSQGTNDLSEAVPLLAALLSIPTADRYPPLNLTPQKRKEKTLNAQLAQVEGLAARQPVLMAFEDVHWSDPTTQESLDLLIDRVPALRVLVIITFRPEFMPPWVGRPHVTLLSLSRLAFRQRTEMISRMAGKTLPKEVLDKIIDRTDGVPLFIEELTKAVIESGVLTDAGDCYTISGPLPPLAIPTSLNESLLARLDRLAPVREVAQIAAALGRQFSHELISAVATMPKQQLDDSLAQLVRAELVFRRGTPPDAEYTFKHALVQDATYSTLLRSRRQQLHADIAATLEHRFPEIVAAQPALLAHHCQEAGLNEKAVDYWLSAGRQAWGRSMITEAVAMLRRGLALVPDLPGSDWRREREFDLQIALAQALTASGGWGARGTRDAYARARQLAVTLNRPRALLFALYGQSTYHWARADLKRARQLAEEIVGLGEESGDLATRVMGSYASGLTCFQVGEFTAARAYFEESIALFDPTDRLAYAELLPTDPHVQLRIHSCWVLGCLGHVDQALSRRDAALDEARRLSHPHTLALALASAWRPGWCVGSNPKSLLEYADELLTLATEHGFGFFRFFALVARGWCLAALGQADDGIPLLTTGIDGAQDTGWAVFRPGYLTLLADAYRTGGQVQPALEHLAEAQRLAGETQERWAQAETLRLRRDVFLATGDPATAEASYGEALTVARQQNAKLWELRAAMSLARLRRDQGKRTQARDPLAPIYGWFTEGFDTPVLKDAKAVLDQLK